MSKSNTKPNHEPASEQIMASSSSDDDNTTPTPEKKTTGTRPTLKSKLQKPIRFHLAFLSLLIMVFIVSLDATALAVAIPKITFNLSGTSLQAFWANISFLLTVTIVQPIYTSTSDILGRKLPLYVAFFLFSLGSIVFALAPSLPVVILGRAIQGLGGGGIDVLNEVIVADITTLRERAFYIGLLSVPMALGTIVGPVLGAVFSEYASWRWIGWVNLPLVGICLPLTVWCLRLKPMEGGVRERLKKVDWMGIAVFTVGATLVTLPVSWAGSMYAWGSWRTVVPLVIGVAVLGGFVWFEGRRNRAVEPMFPYRIFANRTAVATLVGSFVHGMVLYTLLSYLPLFFQAVFLEARLESAVTMIPFCAVLMAFTGISAMGVEWTRRYLWLIWSGWVLLTIGVGLFGLWDVEQSSLGKTVGIQVVAAVGLGTLFTVPPIPMQASTKRSEDQGLAVGILVAFRLFGALLGLAIAATAFSSQFSQLIITLSPLPEAAKILEDPNETLGFIPYLRDLDLPSDKLVEIREVYAKSLRVVFYILAGFGGIGTFASLFTKELNIESEEEGRQGFDV
ncbi:major facilitator superfamily domain-containing protein [Cladorrhinum sp. PSN259]|nr:major facilitator superfamily domain-containing protein [Cladorrhinum sp. PSN259]